MQKFLRFLMLVALLLPFALRAQVSLPINMDFEDAAAFGQWTMTNCQSSTGINSSQAHEGTQSFYFYYTTTPPQYLISPEFTATTGTEMVSFWYKATNTQWGNESFEVGFSSTTNEVTAFEWGTSVEVSNLTWAEYSAAIPEGTKYVAIKSTANDAFYLYIDDIYIGAPPACSNVATLTVGETTTNSITLNWTDDVNDGATYTIYNMSDTSVIEANLSGNSYTVEDLTANTLYTFGIKAFCGADESSNGYATASARTQCTSFAYPYTWDFEDMTTYEAPNCWEKVGSGTVEVYSSDAHSGDKRLHFSDATSNLIMLPATEAEINTLQMKFWIRPETNSSYCGNFSVGYVADGNFTALATYNYTDFIVSGSATYLEHAIMFSSAPEGARMALRAEPTSAYYYWYVDDVTIDELPSCVPVSALAIDTEEATANSLTLTWLSDATDFIIIDMANGEEIGSSTTNSFEATDLDANTAYTFGVVVDCGGEYSDTVTVSGRTACDVISTLPYSMGFEANDLQGTTNALSFPYCWTRINTLPLAESYSYFPYASTSTPHEGDRSLYFYAYQSTYSTYADTVGFILPELDVNTYPMNGNRVTFWAKVTSSTPYNVFVGTMSDPADMSTFSLVDSVSVSSTIYEMKSVSLAEANEEDAYVAFLVPKVYASMYIDDVTLEIMPTCMEVSNVNAIDSLTTPNSITITWVDTLNPAGTEYTIYNMADTTVIENIDIEDNVAVIEGLTSNTVYTFGVQANCGDGDAHFITVSHRTSCAPMPLPFNETFDVSVTNNPCWSGASGITADEVLAGSALTLYTPQWNYASSTQNGLAAHHYYVNIYGTSCKKWIITPEIDLGEVENPLLTFDAAFTVYTSSSNEPASGFESNTSQAFKVLVTTDGGQTWTLASNINLSAIASSTYVPQYVNLSAYAGNTVRIAFYAQSTVSGGDNNLHIDNIEVNESTGDICYPVTDLAASDVTSESATLTWEGETDSYMVYTYTATDTTYDQVYENSIDLDNLEANTTYSYGIAAVCDNGEESVIMTVTFTTPCSAIAIPFVEDFETNSPTVNCWSTANTASSTGLVTSGAYSGSRAFQFWYNTNPPQYLFSPELSGTENGLALSFMYKAGSDYYVESFQIGYSTTTNEITAFTWGTEQIVSNTTYEEYNEILPPGTKYMAVKYTANDKYALNIDNVVFALPPSCIPVAGLDANGITSTNATLTWLGNADNYAVYEISDNDTTLVGTVPEASIELSGLEPNSVYTYGVVSICDDDEESDMVTITFTSACEAVTLPYLESFENGLGCWTTVNGSADGRPWNAQGAFGDGGSITAHTGSYMASSWSWNSSAMHANAWLISPKFILPAGNDSISLSWWHRVNYLYPDELYDVMISTTTNDTAAFATTLLAVSPDSTSEWIQNIVDLTTYAGQEVYVAFHHRDSYNQNYLLIDDIELFQGGYVPPAPDTLTVTFAVNDATMGTTIPAPGTYQYVAGDSVFFGSQANDGYHFAYWVINYSETESDTLPASFANGFFFPANYFLSFNFNSVTLTAYFEAGLPDSTTFTIAVNDATMGTTNPAPGIHTIYLGDNISVEAIPAEGYVLSAWKFDIVLNDSIYQSTTVTSDNPAFENPVNLGIVMDVDFNYVLTAFFEAAPTPPTQYTVTLNTADATMGTVSPAGTTTVNEGASFTATATAAEGYHFVAWMNGDAQVSTENPYTFTVTGNITLTATFEANEPVVTYYEVTVNSADVNMGTVTSTASGQVAENTEVTVTATPAEGYIFVAWMNGNDTVSTANPYTFTVTGDITLTAVFQYEIGIDDFDFSNVNVYSTKSTIIVNGAENQDIFVYDMNGRCIYKHFNANETERINVLSAGAYLVRISNGVTKKVVVVK